MNMHTPMPVNQLHATAISFLLAHQVEQTPAVAQLLLTRCIAHVIDKGNVSRDTAYDITLQAAGELSARGRREYIDCSRTTSYTLFLSDSAGNKRTVTVAELLRLIDQAQLGPSI